MLDFFDNRTKLLGDDLKQELKAGSKVRIAASCFSMYAFDELKEELSEIKELHFLFTEPTFTKAKVSENLTRQSREFYIPKLRRESNLYGSEFEIKLKNKMTMRAIARECAEWVRSKVKFHSNTTRATIPNFVGIKNDGAVAYTHLLKTDTLLHGDYCLPNVILNDWQFNGFIDLDNAGVGDRHVDIFWGIWTLWFNLKTDKYRERFIDVYGRDKVDKDMLRIVAAAEVFG